MRIRRPVHELENKGKNRFERFAIAELAGADALDPFTRTAFLALVQTAGRRAAVGHFDGKPEHGLLKTLVERAAPWWEPKGLWGRGLATLKASGIFPAIASEEPGVRWMI